MVILPVMPRPPAAFSPFTTIKSRPCCSLRSGSRAITAFRPGSPTMSPRKRTFSIEQDRIEEVQNVDVSFQSHSDFVVRCDLLFDIRDASSIRRQPGCPWQQTEMERARKLSGHHNP